MSRDRYGGRSEVGKAVLHRFADAEALFREERWRGAMYMAGYAVECRLKVALMAKHDCLNLKELAAVLEQRGAIRGDGELFTHSLERLLRLTSRGDALRANSEVARQFMRVGRWLPGWRYTADAASEGRRNSS